MSEDPPNVEMWAFLSACWWRCLFQFHAAWQPCHSQQVHGQPKDVAQCLYSFSLKPVYQLRPSRSWWLPLLGNISDSVGCKNALAEWRHLYHHKSLWCHVLLPGSTWCTIVTSASSWVVRKSARLLWCPQNSSIGIGSRPDTTSLCRTGSPLAKHFSTR